jgi:cytochrome P450
MGVRFAAGLLRKYRTGYLRLHMLTTPTVLVFDPEGIRRVLDRSPGIYADPRSKRKGMSHFQPGAVTISRNPDWTNRRAFNEAVLQPGRLHEFADRFLTVAREEVARLASGTMLTWLDIEGLFARLTRRVIFGDRAHDDEALTEAQNRLMRQSNRLVSLRRNASFTRLYDRIRGYLGDPEPQTLVALCHKVPSDEHTRVENQIPHWLFAMKDTLAINTVYTLALIGASQDDEQRVRGELSAGTALTAPAIDQCRHLEGCVQEAMRLWPTTALLLRETVCAEKIGDRMFPPGIQVLIWNPFNHRNRSATPDADRFRPGRWAKTSSNYQYNHLSNGPQGCAGKSLALFLAKAVLAEQLTRATYRSEQSPYRVDGTVVDAFNPFRAAFARGEVKR